MNITKNPFLTWVFITGLALTGFFWAWYAGIIKLILATDFTYITLGLFIFAAILISCLAAMAYKLQFKQRELLVYEDYAATFFRQLEMISSLSSRLPQIGFVGTVIGLAHLLQTSTSGITIADSALVQSLMTQIGTTSGAALYPTLIGLIGYLTIQAYLDVFHYIFEGRGYAKA